MARLILHMIAQPERAAWHEDRSPTQISSFNPVNSSLHLCKCQDSDWDDIPVVGLVTTAEYVPIGGATGGAPGGMHVRDYQHHPQAETRAAAATLVIVAVGTDVHCCLPSPKDYLG